MDSRSFRQAIKGGRERRGISGMTKRAGHRGFSAVNKKAERKLDFIGQRLVAALGEDGSCSSVAPEPLARVLDLRCCPETGPLTIRYRPQSKLFAILYDLVCEFSVVGPYAPGCALEVVSGSAKFVGAHTNGGSDSRVLIPALVENGLVEERLRLLGVTQASAAYDDRSDMWRVSVSLMVGSATWNLLPPIMHLIEPSADEYLRMIELFRLLAVGIRSA